MDSQQPAAIDHSVNRSAVGEIQDFFLDSKKCVIEFNKSRDRSV